MLHKSGLVSLDSRAEARKIRSFQIETFNYSMYFIFSLFVKHEWCTFSLSFPTSTVPIITHLKFCSQICFSSRCSIFLNLWKIFSLHLSLLFLIPFVLLTFFITIVYRLAALHICLFIQIICFRRKHRRISLGLDVRQIFLRWDIKSINYER